MKTRPCPSLLRAGLLTSLVFFNAVASGRAQSSIVINEFMADNRSTLENNGDYPDWVELYNSTGQPIDLADRSLTDDLTLPRKYIFPAGTTIPAGGFLVVYCDNRSGSPGLHTGFALNDKGDTIALFASLAAGGFQEDAVAFGLQLPDYSNGRVPDGGGAFALNPPTPAGANLAVPMGDRSRLKINEWSALNGASASDPDPDWFELYNPDPRPVALEGLVFTDQLTPPATHLALPGLSFIAGNGFTRFFADDKIAPADNVNFKLGSTSGDRIQLFQADRSTLIDAVTFEAQTLNVSQGRLPDGAANLVFFPVNRPTPAESNFLPLTNVVINEVLIHTDLPFEDAIELRNVSAASIDISSWWLSNDPNQPQKFRIPAGTILGPGAFVVFYEGANSARGFNTSGTGESPDFTLNSTHGDELHLFTADSSGALTGSRANVKFGAAENGVSFGRVDLSTGESDMAPLERPTFGVDQPTSVEQFRTGTGRPNAPPKIGPIIISEIFYHPPDLPSGTNLVDNSLDEFIELKNLGTSALPLFDLAHPLNTWRLRGGVDFEFPISQTLGAGQCLLFVNFDVEDLSLLGSFRARFNVPSTVAIYGPYRGKLSNSSATVDLQKPDNPQLPPHPDAGYVPYVTVDRVHYSDSPPWPTSPDGVGNSLQRAAPVQYANDPASWSGDSPTAGIAGSRFRIESFGKNGQLLNLCFKASAGATYSVLSSVSPTAPWTKVMNVTASGTGLECVTLPFPTGSTPRFYRLVTPAQP